MESYLAEPTSYELGPELICFLEFEPYGTLSKLWVYPPEYLGGDTVSSEHKFNTKSGDRPGYLTVSFVYQNQTIRIGLPDSILSPELVELVLVQTRAGIWRVLKKFVTN